MALPISVPEELVAYHLKWYGEAARPWLDAAPGLVANLLDQWRLRADGEPMNGLWGLIVPVICEDETAAVLKVQPLTSDLIDVAGEALALRTWDGNGAVRLLDYHEASGSMLLERLDATTPLATVQDGVDALQILCELLVRLTSVGAPPGLRRLSDLGARLLERTPVALKLPMQVWQRSLLVSCSTALRDVLAEPGNRLLHVDLHYDNVLAPLPDDPREPWLAIDPNPLAGDPGFALLAALHNRWDEAVASGDVPRAVRRRFDLMTEVLGLDRERARAWTLARVLETVLWDVENDDTVWHTQPDKAIAETLLA